MKKYQFKVPCHYHYEIVAKNEDEAREILLNNGGIGIEGQLCFDDNAYKDAELNN
jgi:hypothetical protein